MEEEVVDDDYDEGEEEKQDSSDSETETEDENEVSESINNSILYGKNGIIIFIIILFCQKNLMSLLFVRNQTTRRKDGGD